MFSFLLVFGFVVLLIFALIKFTDWLFIYQSKITSKKLAILFNILGIILAFILAFYVFILGIKFIFNPTQYFTNRETKVDVAELIKLNVTDCKILLETIERVEKTIAPVEKHRYIEAEVPLFTLKLEYEKGANELQKQASRYKNLELAENSNIYVQKMAQKLQTKADLFTERVETKADKEGSKKIYMLLDQMDRVTEERQTLIKQIEQQCNQG